MNTNLLKQLYKIYSPSGNEAQMINFIKLYIKKKLRSDIKIEEDKYGNLYVTKGKSDTYPCLVSHLDQVSHCYHSEDFDVIETKDLLMGYSLSKKQSENLGADDKNGIFVCLECLKKYDVLKVAFFREEEVGCCGSYNANISFFKNVRFVVQADRRGNSDLIVSIGRTNICSDKFISDVNPSEWGYKETEGMMTDVEALRNQGVEVSCVNVSCGYYNPHTDEEITIKEDLQKCLNFVQHIIEDCTDVYEYKYQQINVNKNLDSCRNYTGYNCDYDYGYMDCLSSNSDELYDELYEFMMYNPELTFEELWDYYLCDYDYSKHEAREMFDIVYEDLNYYRKHE